MNAVDVQFCDIHIARIANQHNLVSAIALLDHERRHIISDATDPGFNYVDYSHYAPQRFDEKGAAYVVFA